MRAHHIVLALASTAALAKPYAGGAAVEKATTKRTVLSDAGKPLYRWKMGTKPGDVTGDSVGGVAKE